MPEKEHTILELDGRDVRFTSPSKVYFPKHGYTKLDLCEYCLSVADECLRHLRDRPTTMKRFREGLRGDFFFQKRVRPNAPPWLEHWTLHFPSGRSANFLVARTERTSPGGSQKGEPKRVQPSKDRDRPKGAARKCGA